MCGIPDVLYVDNGADFVSKHLEQVAVDLKIRLVFSTPGRPQGRGKIERFFRTVNEMFLCDLEGYTRRGRRKPTLTLEQLDEQFRAFLIEGYQRTPVAEAELAPSAKWEQGGFLPRVPASLEQLDLLLIEEIRPRKVRRDGIHFQGFRYLSLTLAAYVGENVTIRYDPRDMAEFASSIRTASSAGPSPPKSREKLLRSATSFVFATAVVENSGAFWTAGRRPSMFSSN